MHQQRRGERERERETVTRTKEESVTVGIPFIFSTSLEAGTPSSAARVHPSLPQSPISYTPPPPLSLQLLDFELSLCCWILNSEKLERFVDAKRRARAIGSGGGDATNEIQEREREMKEREKERECVCVSR